MKHDIMRRLADARPARLDPGAPVGDEVRTAELAMAMREADAAPSAAARPARTPARTPARPWLRPRWGVGLVSAAAAAAAIAVTLAPADGGSGPDGTAASAGQDLLLTAAARVEAADGTAGQGAFWYQKERYGSLHQVPGADGQPGYVIDDRHDSQDWLAQDAKKRWSRSDGVGARPASEKDETAWRKAGSPKRWDTAGGLSYEGAGLITQDAPGGNGDTMPMGEVQIAELRELPTEAKALRERLHELVDKEYNAPDAVMQGLIRAKAVEIAVHLPSGPELRAAAYRLLAAEPGVRDLGKIKDHSGREGYGVAIPYEKTDIELRIVLDTRTGAPLGTLTATTDAHDGWPKGATIRYTTNLGQNWTDTPPPFTEDKQPEADTPPPGPGPDLDARPVDAPDAAESAGTSG
ncbi:CU044_5270 family protein [Streptomyces jumonjinensis]|uniref:CU044_5270 family protein n=1 Tax=Streptomyces jumonjinensis TaxID=1945 RepID=A0A646KFJ7_STRJU|nr:CU044_5270 family protein [Streptomyces jumonjinensis]MQS99785.1 hypothetical protein [Streptomyces jumonjinensis]